MTLSLPGKLFALLLLFPVADLRAQPSRVQTSAGSVSVQILARGLDHPWGMAFLPDRRLLVTERSGSLRILRKDKKLSAPLRGVPKVYNVGQGGLLDVALDPGFGKNKLVYLSFSEPGTGGASTALGRGRLSGTALRGFKVIFRQLPKVEGPNHFGSRIVFSRDRTIFLTLGERFQFTPAQDLSNDLGKIVRITRSGTAPKGNPFTGNAGARPEIWSYGHRNIEAAAIQPGTRAFWIGEMGPMGGDELNLVEPGKNYGWPLVSWGNNYDGTDIPDPPTRPDLSDAALHWTPVISPSGMIFYTGRMFRAWRGMAFLGGLTTKELVRVKIDGRQAKEEERIPLGARIRDVEQAPDGSIYVLTDEEDGKVLRVSPVR